MDFDQELMHWHYKRLRTLSIFISLIAIMFVAIEDNRDLAYAQITPAAEKAGSHNTEDSGAPTSRASIGNADNNEAIKSADPSYTKIDDATESKGPGEVPAARDYVESEESERSNSLIERIFDQVRQQMNASGISDLGL